MVISRLDEQTNAVLIEPLGRKRAPDAETHSQATEQKEQQPAQTEIQRVKNDLDRLNKENLELGALVKALKTDPRLIEKIAREDLQRARPGEIIIRIPQSQPSAGEAHAKP